MEIVSEAQPDATTTQEDKVGFEPNEKKRDSWCVVGVEFRKKFTMPVSLKELQKYGGTGALGELQMFKQSRLSVSKVEAAEWNFIIDNLVKGYEEEDGEALEAVNGTEAAAGDQLKLQDNDGGEKMADDEVPNGTSATGPIEKELTGAATTAEEDAGFPETTTMHGAMPEFALPSVESDLPSTDTMLPSATAATSRPASRAASRAPSRASRGSRQVSRAPSAAPPISGAIAVEDHTMGGSRPASRAGSLAPSVAARPSSRAGSVAPPVLARPASRAGSLGPSLSAARPSSRGRSRTPKPRAGSAQPMGSVTEEGQDAMEAMDDIDAMTGMDAIAE